MGFSDVAIRGYQKYISRDYNAHNHAHCMYYPTCSEFVKESMVDDGFWRGGMDGIMRLLRCDVDIRQREVDGFLDMLRTSATPDVVVDGPASQQVVDRLKLLTDQ